MFSSETIATIFVLVLMLTSSVTLFSILLVSFLSGGEIHLLTNTFDEVVLELGLFLIAVIGGAILLIRYLKRVALKKKANGEL